MFNKIFYFIKRHKNKGKCSLKQEKGFSLVEVIVALVIISIITVVLIRGTIMAVNVSKMNRAKTLSSAVASEKLELIKCLDYGDIEVDNPDWPPLDDPDHPEYVELTEVGYIIDYEVTWVDGVEDSYKQVEISVSKENMNMKSVSVITQLYPMEKQEEEISEHLPPENLRITGYSGGGSARTVNLAWDTPDTQLVVIQYVVYKEGVEVGRTTNTNYQNTIGNNSYSFYITAIYEGEIESDPSKIVTTVGYPPPQYLRIINYTGSGNNRTVNLAWDAPDTQLVIVQYVVYRNGVEVGRTTNRIFSNRIRNNNYTFKVTAIYEGGIESEPSNEVTTQ